MFTIVPYGDYIEFHNVTSFEYLSNGIQFICDNIVYKYNHWDIDNLYISYKKG